MPEHHLEILKMLEENAFEEPSRIAKLLNISEDEVKATIARLESEKMILGYRAVINKEKLFEDKVFAVIEVNVSPERDEGFDRIARRIYQFPEVHSLYLFSGNFDFLVFVRGNNLKEVANFVARKLSTIEGVAKTATHFELKTYKENGMMLDDIEGEERLKVAP